MEGPVVGRRGNRWGGGGIAVFVDYGEAVVVFKRAGAGAGAASLALGVVG